MNAIASLPALAITGTEQIEISSTVEAKAQRDELLAIVSNIKAIATPAEAEAVALILRDAKAYLGLVEASRVATKAPLLEQGRQVDALAQELTARLTVEAKRIGQVLGAFTAEQSRKAEEARQLAWQEEQRILREAQEKERQEREKAEAAQRELERKQSVARTEENRAKYEAEAEQRRLKAEQEQAQRDLATEQQIIATRQQAVNVAAAKPAGISSRRVLKYEITDIVALYEAAPMLVKLEPAPAALKEALKSLRTDQTLPGVKHWYEADVSVR